MLFTFARSTVLSSTFLAPESDLPPNTLSQLEDDIWWHGGAATQMLFILAMPGGGGGMKGLGPPGNRQAAGIWTAIGRHWTVMH